MQRIKTKTELFQLTAVSKIRVLDTLNQHGKLVLAQISRKTGLNHSTTIKALKHLCDAGFVNEEKEGKQRFFETTFQEFHVQFRVGSGLNMKLK